MKNVSELAVGDEVVIAASGSNYALGTTQNSNNRAAVSITKSGDNITWTTTVQVLTLKAGTKTGTFAFYTGSGYLYAASSSNNYLRTETKLSDNSSWSISITSGGVASITAQGTNTNNQLKKNSSSALFSCYSSGQGSVAIYKKQATVTKTLSSITLSGQTTTYNVGDSFLFDGTCTAKYSDGSTKAVTPTSVSSPDMNNAGTPTVTVSYTEGGVSVNATYTITVSAVSSGDGECTWQLVTDASTLKADDEIIIAASGNNNYALSTNQKSSNRGATAITKNGNTLTSPSADVQILALKAGSTSGTWAFYTGTDGYLYAASSSGNQLKTKTALDVHGSWTISITDGVASIVATGSSNRNIMQYNYNNGSPLFACYSSATQTSLALYKKVCPTATTYSVTSTLSHVTASGGNPTSVTDADDELMLEYSAESGWNLPANITVTMGGAALSSDDDYMWDDGELYIAPTGGFTGDIVVSINGWQQLATPQNLSSEVTANSATLIWDEVANAKSYLVTIVDGDDLSADVPNTQTSYTFNNLTPQTDYLWTVKAIGDKVNYTDSEESETAEFTTKKACTDAVTISKGTETNGTFTLSTTDQQSTCNGPVTVTLSNIEPAVGYQFSAITQTGINSGVTIDNNNKTVTYAKNTTGNSTINVTFAPVVYTITYKDQGGANFSGQHEAGYPTTHTYNTATTLKSASKEHYTFGGWYKESDCSETAVTTLGATEYTENITLYAQWTAKTYTIILDANGGTFVDNRDSQTKGRATFDYIYGTYATYNEAPNLTNYYTDLKRDGYRFDKWVSAGSPWNKLFTSTGDRTIQAQWSKLYTITLSENGTTTTPITQTSTSYTLPTELSAGSCQDDTKELVGWSTVAIPTPGDKPTSNFYDLGETVTLTADQTTFYAVFATVEETTGGTIDATLSFANTQNRVSHSDSKHVWAQNDITFTNNKASSTSDVNDAYNPIRCYKNSSITITHTSNEITKIVFDCNGTNEASHISDLISPLENSGTGTVTTSDDIITITFNKSQKSFTFNLSSGQVRLDGITVTTGGGTTTTYSEYTTTCVKLPDPVLSFATEPANPIEFTDVACGGNSSKQSVTVVGENLRDVVNVSVTGPYKIARTASTAVKDFTTSLTLDKTAVGAIHSNYQTVYIISTPPAQSTEATTGALTFTTTKGNTLTVNLSTPTVTCTQYTLTLVDRGVSTEQPTKYYAGETIDEAPADPTGVCTDPIHYVFDGWAETTVTNGSTGYTPVSFPYTVTSNTKFYAVYRYVGEGSVDSGDYVKVTENLDDYSGDYLIVYETGNVAFNGGLDDLDVTSNTISVTINSNTIESNATTDAAKFTIAKVDGGYSIKSASGYYIGWGGAKNGLNTNSSYTVNYRNTISDNTICGNTGYLKFNKTSGQERFRYYQSGQEAIALYRKVASYLYTTSPACGPHLEITDGKEIYVTGGNAGGTRDLVIAQQKVSYKATRLKTSNGLADGTAPDVKVATNGITVGGVVTQDVKVTIDKTKEQQTDGTYTITGTVTVQYQPSANNKQEDIQVQLAVDYNTEAKDNFTIHARSLPAEFVIVAKSGDKWYALNGDMNNGSSANPANGQVTLDNNANPTKATYAPCNAIYTFDGLPNTGDRTYVRFQGTDGAWLWASSGTNVGVQNNVLKTTPEGSNKAYNWKLYTEDNITYRFGNANSSRQLTLSGEKFGMYASGVQEFRILPYEAKCLYNYAPTNLKVSVLKGTYVTLTWDAVAGATKYQYSTNGTTWTDAGTEPTATITGLTGNTKYTCYVRAYHEGAGVSQECIDYEEITFTTADCDDVPTNITYTADLNSITVSWTAAAPTATIKYNTKEDGTGGGGTIENATSPCRISGGLNPNTTYYIQILAGGDCASPIIPVKTKDVEVDIVEWKTDGIVVDINTNEKISVSLENEVSFGSNVGAEATELFFSKYYEASYNVKLVAIYNGTKNIIDLEDYTIQYGKTSWETSYITLKDFGATKGQIQPGEEIILYSYTENNADDKKILDCVHEDFPDGNWVRVTSSNNDGKGTLSFGGDKTIILCKTEYDDEADEYYDNIIDVIGALIEDPNEGILPTNENTEKPSWGDKEGWVCETGLSIADDSQIGISTNRCLLVRNNTVTSGLNAVANNIEGDFVTLCSEWKGAHVPDDAIDNGVAASCENFAYIGTFDYSDYYTKYVSMGKEQVFEKNTRNDDGTVTISIPELSKQSCRNIRIIIKDNNTKVISNQEYKVPIMITTTQGTDGQAFLALQENLATVEVDGNGNPTGNKTNITLEQAKEICKTCDVVVRDNATLMKMADDAANDHPQVRNIYVYENSSLIVPNGTNYTINNLSLRRKGDKVSSLSAYPDALKLPESAATPISLDLRVDANNWHWFTLPYNCNIADVTWVDGSAAQYNVDWFLMTYDGEQRANTQSGGCWKQYNGTTIEAGKGYIVGITGDLTNSNYTFELRFPMAKEVLANEGTNKTVDVRAWGVETNIRPNHKGWNLVGNPYLAYYQRDNITNFAGLRLGELTGPDPQTGYWEQTGNVPYVVIPIEGGWVSYEQVLASETDLMPFTAYFVQVGNDGDHDSDDELSISFDHTKLQLSTTPMPASIVRRAPAEIEETEEPIIVGVSLTNGKGESDKTSLVIDDRFTNEYEMNADFFKWFGDYYNYYTKPVLYTIGADQEKRAFNALNEELAKQPIPMGMYAAQAGNYTFSLNKRADLSRVEEVWLYDATQSTYTNLMQSDYTFSTSKVNGAGRFSLSVKLAPKVATSIDNLTANKVWATTHTKQVIVNGLENGMHLWLYDATGKLLYNEPTSNYQHTYSVPQTGTYFVSVMNGNQKQTIKVVVE